MATYYFEEICWLVFQKGAIVDPVSTHSLKEEINWKSRYRY